MLHPLGVWLTDTRASLNRRWNRDKHCTNLRTILAVCCWLGIGRRAVMPRWSYQFSSIRVWPCDQGIQLAAERNGICWSSTLLYLPLRLFSFCQHDECGRPKWWKRLSRHPDRPDTCSTWTKSTYGRVLVRNTQATSLIQVLYVSIWTFISHGRKTLSYVDLACVDSSSSIQSIFRALRRILLHQLYRYTHPLSTKLQRVPGQPNLTCTDRWRLHLAAWWFPRARSSMSSVPHETVGTWTASG